MYIVGKWVFSRFSKKICIRATQTHRTERKAHERLQRGANQPPLAAWPRSAHAGYPMLLKKGNLFRHIDALPSKGFQYDYLNDHSKAFATLRGGKQGRAFPKSSKTSQAQRLAPEDSSQETKKSLLKNLVNPIQRKIATAPSGGPTPPTRLAEEFSAAKTSRTIGAVTVTCELDRPIFWQD